MNDIPEDNIVSLQEENASLQAFVDSVNASGCTDSLACNYNQSNLYEDGTCEYPEEMLDCEGNIIPIYEIGEFAEGGIVFYVDETGQHGLVAAIEDLEGLYEWGCYEQAMNGAHGSIIGTGYQNTLDITNSCSATIYGGPTAAAGCVQYEHEGYTDWFLPSRDELNEMYYAIGPGAYDGYCLDANLAIPSCNYVVEVDENNNYANFQHLVNWVTSYRSSTKTNMWYTCNLDFMFPQATYPCNGFSRGVPLRVRPIRSF